MTDTSKDHNNDDDEKASSSIERQSSEGSAYSFINNLFHSSDSTTELLRNQLFKTDDKFRSEDPFKSNGSFIANLLKEEGGAQSPREGSVPPASAFQSTDSFMAKIIPSISSDYDDSKKQPLPRVTRSTSSNSANIFNSGEWAPEYKGRHVDVDFNHIFKSNVDTNQSTAVTGKTSGIDWEAMYQAELAGTNAMPAPDAVSSRTPKRKPQPLPSVTQATTLLLKPIPSPSAPKVASSALQLPPVPVRIASKRKRSQSEGSRQYIEPNDEDVLSGRGGRTNNHAGNKRYLHEKDVMQGRYLAASKHDKTGISQELVDIVHGWGGRFLKLDESNDKWYEVTAKVARKKASQSLREINTPEERAAKRARYTKKY